MELWDTSSDPSYESCWPAVFHELDGLLLVYHPLDPTGADQVSMWWEEGVKWSRVEKDRCRVLMQGEEEEMGIPSGWKRPSGLEGVDMYKTTFEDGGEVKRHVMDFVYKIARWKRSKEDGVH